ncbi:MAG: hypothetical protein HY675_07860 [Chloroflexi bacterium]|nr:hypothetical protein [Chloroflexota bacterium]
MAKLYKKMDLQVVLEQSKATKWEDLLRYLRAHAAERAKLGRTEMAQMATDLDKLDRTGTPFTKDVDRLWEIVGGA